MITSIFSKVNPARQKGCFGAVLIACLICLGGCQPKAADVVGTYVRNGVISKERITLSPDCTFIQEIEYTNGGRYRITNAWGIVKGVVDLSGFLCSFNDQTGNEQFPPKSFTVVSLEIQPGVLIGDYERGYFFRKVKMASN
jgi:hypothetical protein